MADEAPVSPARVVILGGMYVAASAALICFNKYMLHRDIFPFPELLVVMHMFSSTILSVISCCLMPSWYPTRYAISDMGWSAGSYFLLTRFLPLGIFFAGTLCLSNHAYMYCSVAFLQMLKEGNVVLVWVMSYAVGLEVYNSRIAFILIWTLVGATVAAYGEINFVILGFILQVSSQVFECAKIVGQNMIMDAASLKLDPLTTVMFMAPCCLVVLAPVMYFRHDPLALPQAIAVWPLVLGNCLTAFALNVIVSMFIKCGKGVGFILMGIVKDIIIVTASAWLFHTPLAFLQIFGFNMALMGIFAYGIMKMDPKKFENGVLNGLYEVLFVGTGMARQEKRVASPMISDKAARREEAAYGATANGEKVRKNADEV